MEITEYKSDSGNKDFLNERRYSKNIPFSEILKKARELKAFLIVKTSYINDDKPGAWYIKGYNKGYNNDYTYEEIKSRIEENVRNNKYTRRTCYLIKYVN